MKLTIHCLCIIEYPVFVIRPKNASVKLNESAMFNCSLTGYPKPKVLWYKKKPKVQKWESLAESKRVEIFPNGSLLLRNVVKQDELAYKCIGGNAGEFNSSTAYLVIFKEKGKSH